MNRPRILVTGASGLLGSTLVRTWQSRYDVVAASGSRELRSIQTWVGNLTITGAAEELVACAKPDFVVHAAAWTDVDGCEADPPRAMRVNAEATGRLAAASHRARAAFAYISTESVFDGLRGGYRETDRPNPISQYAVSKLAGEHETLGAHPDAIVLRTGLEGWRPWGKPGFVQWVIEGLRRGEPRTICIDWIHTVIFAANVVEVIERLWTVGASGILHAGCDTPASNWEIAWAAAQEFKLDSALLTPISSEALRLRAPRPKNTSLISERLRDTVGPVVWELGRGLAHMRQQEASGELDALRDLVKP